MGFKLFLLCNFLLKNQHLLSIADSDISVSVPHPQPPKCNGKLNRDIYSRMERRDIFHLEMSVVVFFFTSIFTCKFALLLRPCFILGKHLGGKFPASPCNYPGCMACSSLLPTAPKTVTTGTSLCICQLRMIKKEASRGPIYFFFLFKTFGNNLSSCIRAHSLALSLLLPITAPLSPPELPKWTDVCSSGSRFNPQSAEQTHR